MYIKSCLVALIFYIYKTYAFAIVGNPLIFAYPCINTEVVYENFETNQPPEDENKYFLGINLKNFVHGPSLSKNSKIILTFDQPAKLTLKDPFGRISVQDSKFIINFYKEQHNDIGMFVRGKQGKPVPNLLSLVINEEELCPDGVKLGQFDSLIVGAQNSAETLRISSTAKECGMKKIKHNALIYNGKQTKPGDWPWHAAIYRIEEELSLQKYICGGSLLSNTIVITAAHCIVDSTSAKVLPSRLIVTLGKYNLAGGDISSQEKKVYNIISFNRFDITTMRDDIALLKLSSEVLYNEYIQPICLWQEEKKQKTEIYDKLGTVVGWGISDSTKKTSNVLLQANIPAVSYSTCLESYPNFFQRFLTRNSYCAGFANGTNSCNGDSGGGMVFPEIGEDGLETWYLRGITSLSVSSRDDGRTCDAEHYVIFTDVANYLEWIEENI